MKVMTLCALALLVAVTGTRGEDEQKSSELDTLKAQYTKAQAAIDSEFAERHDAALKAYGDSLDGYLDYLKKRGELDDYLALEKERERFEAEQSVPPTGRDNPYVKRAAAQYDRTIAIATANRTKRTEHLLRQYTLRLKSVITELMRADLINDAKLAKLEIERVAALGERAPVAAPAVREREPTAPPPQAERKEPAAEPPVAHVRKAATAAVKTNTGGRMSITEQRRLKEHMAKYPVPKDATEYRGHHYKAIIDRTHWHDAKAKCEALGGHLATIADKGESDFLIGLVPHDEYGARNLWIGLEDQDRDGTWKWIDGSTLKYSRLKPSGMLHKRAPDANYAAFDIGYRQFLGWFVPPGEKDSRIPDKIAGYICEWDY